MTSGPPTPVSGTAPAPVRVIAIDGPAASGKSSTAEAVARATGFVHIDSGALYRALTWIAVQRGSDDPAAISATADARHVGYRLDGGQLRLHIDGVPDVEGAIRATDVTARVSAIAALAPLRDWTNARIRAALARLPGAVIDGRDIGTVVIPEAPLKIFLTATPEARAGRRLAQRGVPSDAARVAAEAAALAERDRRDSARATAPLRQAPDAVVVDTTGLSFAEQVSRIVTLARGRGLLTTG